MSQAKVQKITNYLNQQDVTFACPILVEQGDAVVVCRKGESLTFILCEDSLQPSPQAHDLAARIEGAEGTVYFVEDWLDVKQALEEISETEDDTSVALGCSNDD